MACAWSKVSWHCWAESARERFEAVVALWEPLMKRLVTPPPFWLGSWDSEDSEKCSWLGDWFREQDWYRKDLRGANESDECFAVANSPMPLVLFSLLDRISRFDLRLLFIVAVLVHHNFSVCVACWYTTLCQCYTTINAAFVERLEQTLVLNISFASLSCQSRQFRRIIQALSRRLQLN